jgi:hypothetical protein
MSSTIESATELQPFHVEIPEEQPNALEPRSPRSKART